MCVSLNNHLHFFSQQFTKDTPEHHIINEILDVDHIKAQLKEGALDIFGCQKISKLVIGVIVCVNDRMKSVERKEETLALWKEREAAFTEANAQVTSPSFVFLFVSKLTL